jgi:hypothetical protein
MKNLSDIKNRIDRILEEETSKSNKLKIYDLVCSKESIWKLVAYNSIQSAYQVVNKYDENVYRHYLFSTDMNTPINRNAGPGYVTRLSEFPGVNVEFLIKNGFTKNERNLPVIQNYSIVYVENSNVKEAVERAIKKFGSDKNLMLLFDVLG